MIFEAIIIPTPKRIKRYFQEVIEAFNTESVIFEKSIEDSKEEVKEDVKEQLEHIDTSKDTFKNPGMSIKFF